MLPTLALLASLANPVDTYIAECAQAVKSFKEGRYGYDVESQGHSVKASYLIKGESNLFQVVVDGKAVSDMLRTSTRFLAVDYAKSRYAETTYAYQPLQTDPLQPLAARSFDFRLDATHGFVLRTNPELTDAKISSASGQETLTAHIVAEGKEVLQVTVVRDERTKLPQSVTVKPGEQPSVTFRLSFEPRSVLDAEITIPASKYAGFAKVDSVED